MSAGGRGWIEREREGKQPETAERRFICILYKGSDHGEACAALTRPAMLSNTANSPFIKISELL